MNLIRKINYILFVILPFVSSCVDSLNGENRKEPKSHSSDDITSEPTTSTTIPKPSNYRIILETTYLNIKEENVTHAVKYSLKKSIHHTVFISKNGVIIDNSEIAKISYDDFKGVDYIIIPQRHWFTEQFLRNPFLILKDRIDLVRPNIWGFELIALFENTDVWILKRGENIKTVSTPKTMNQAELDALFVDYKTHLLGKGGTGEVYTISFAHKEYALKSNATEAFNLEQLQFTNTVIPVFASFMVDKQPYVIMEKGVMDLASMNQKKEKLSAAKLLSTIDNFKHLLDAQKKLSIKNEDIKPENILITSFGDLKIIDISSSYTRGHHGTPGELLARALLSNHIGQDLRSDYIRLERYFEFPDPLYRSVNIASPYFLQFWYGLVCEKVLNDKARCTGIKSFPDLFHKMSFVNLHEIGLRADEYYKEDPTGTIDDKKYGPYRTGLRFPNLQDPALVDWLQFFKVKNTIAKQFCLNVEINRGSRSVNRTIFPSGAYERYEAFCIPTAGGQPGDFTFTKNFLSPSEPEFQSWILAAYEQSILEETFRQLARENPIRLVYPLIFAHELDLTDPNGIGKSLWQLYNYKP